MCLAQAGGEGVAGVRAEVVLYELGHPRCRLRRLRLGLLDAAHRRDHALTDAVVGGGGRLCERSFRGFEVRLCGLRQRCEGRAELLVALRG